MHTELGHGQSVPEAFRTGALLFSFGRRLFCGGQESVSQDFK